MRIRNIKMGKGRTIQAVTDSSNTNLFYIDLSEENYILDDCFQPVSEKQAKIIENHPVFTTWLKSLPSSETYI